MHYGVCVCLCACQLDDRDGVKRRPPARLESLKAQKAESLYSKEEIEEKIRLAEERRKVCTCVCSPVLCRSFLLFPPKH